MMRLASPTSLTQAVVMSVHARTAWQRSCPEPLGHAALYGVQWQGSMHCRFSPRLAVSRWLGQQATCHRGPAVMPE